MQQDANSERLLTYAEVADWLGMSVGKLRKDVLLGRGPRSVKIGRLRRFRSEDIHDFIEENLTFSDKGKNHAR